MPVVPFSGVPTVAPSGQPESYLRTPSGLDAAAGLGVAQAISGLGGQIEKSADMLAHHAVVFQNIQNEADAKNGDVDGMVAIGQVMSEYGQLEGTNATKRLPEFQQKIKDIRDKALDGMPNMAARRMLDQSISRRVGFTLVDMGRHAGTQAKVAVNQASTARVEAAKAGYDPSNPMTAKNDEHTLEAEIRQKGEEFGMYPETVNNIVRKEKSQMYRSGITKMAKNDPEGAKGEFERVKEVLDPGDREVLQQVVDQNMAAKQTRTDAQAILKKTGFDPLKGPGQEEALMKEAEKYKEKNKDNPAYADNLDSRVKTLYGTGMQGFRDKQNGFEHTIGKFILGQDDANRVVSIDGIVGPDAPKDVQEAYQGLEPAKQKKVLSWIRQMSDGGGRTLTPDRLKKEQELKGMASDPTAALDFVNLGPDGIIKENLTPAQTRGLLELQRKLGTSPKFIDSFVNKGMKQVEGMLNAAGVTRGRAPQEYFAFRGAFEDVIRDQMGDKGVLPPPKELEAMASRLLQDQYKDQWYRPASRIFEGGGMSNDVRSEIVQEYKSRGIAEPTDEQIARTYSLILYKRLYSDQGKAPKADKQ